MEDDFGARYGAELGQGVAGREQVDALVAGAEEALPIVAALHVAAGDEHVEMTENGKAERLGFNFLERVAAEDEAAETGAASGC